MGVEIPFSLTLDGEEIGGQLSSDQAADLVDDIVSTVGTYDLDIAVFRCAMRELTTTAADRRVDADVLLEMDEVVTKLVMEFREALHGETVKP